MLCTALPVISGISGGSSKRPTGYHKYGDAATCDVSDMLVVGLTGPAHCLYSDGQPTIGEGISYTRRTNGGAHFVDPIVVNDKQE